MLPILFKIGPLTVHTYSLLVATGMLTGITLAYYRAPKEGIDTAKVLDLCFFIIIGAIIGSRILYVIVNYKEFLASPLDVFKLWAGGLVFYGGFIGALITSLWFVKKHKLPIGKTADLIAPYLAIAHSISRWGCLAAGCGYGRPTDSWTGIIFTNPLSIAPLGITLYPTQIFDSINEFIIFLILIAIRPYKKFDGQLFLLWMMLYAVGRSIVEHFRGDAARGYIITDVISTSQGISAVIFTIVLVIFIRSMRTAR